MILDNPFAPSLIACGLVGASFAVGLLIRPSRVVASLAAPAVFLVAYYEIYQKVPSFPPIGASNKIFYIVLIAALYCAAVTKISNGRYVDALSAAAIAIFATTWIGFAQFGRGGGELLATVGALAIGGALVLLQICIVTAADAPIGGEAEALVLLAATAVCLAPVALFGGSSTSVGLCLAFAFGAAVLSLAPLLSRRQFGAVTFPAAGGGLIAVVNSMVLITRHADLLVAPLAALPPFVGPLAIRLLPTAARKKPIYAWGVTGLAALSPLPVIVALLLLRHESPI
jgi:hypothetical protein